MRGIESTYSDISLDHGWEPRQVLAPIVPGALALALIGAAGAWVLHARLATVPAIATAPAARPAPATVSAAEADANLYGVIVVDPAFISEMAANASAGNVSAQASLDAGPPAPSGAPQPKILHQSETIPLPEIVPLPPTRDVPQIVDSAPLPPPRPTEFGPLAIPTAPSRDLAQKNEGASGPAAPADNRNFFQKLFGFGQPSGPVVDRPAAGGRVANTAPQAGVAKGSEGRVAYAAPLANVAVTSQESHSGGRSVLGAFPPPFGASVPASGYDRYTAVYDISARTVYLPDGTRLEAHSGLGDRLDDPRYVGERMRGPTPPNIYELEPREASFHGVQALRLNPVGDSAVYGRAGLLAHPYMLGPNGDSNGCVSFKDYNTFLRAYQNGQIKRLVVVARLG
jgi:type VI secretion system (T6SS) effector TldE1-like protein